MFKRYLVLSVLLGSVAVLAQVTSNQAPVVVGPASSAFDLKLFLHQVAVNGGLALLAFLVGFLPGKLGEWARKVVDFVSANVAHKK